MLKKQQQHFLFFLKNILVRSCKFSLLALCWKRGIHRKYRYLPCLNLFSKATSHPESHCVSKYHFSNIFLHIGGGVSAHAQKSFALETKTLPVHHSARAQRHACSEKYESDCLAGLGGNLVRFLLISFEAAEDRLVLALNFPA